MELNETKLKAAIAYLVSKAPVPPGKVQLFKWLYLADFSAYAQRGEPITGESYENFEGGPVPQFLWRNYRTIIDAILDVTRVRLNGVRFPKEEMRLKDAGACNYEPLLEFLSPGDRTVLDDIIGKYGRCSGTELRRITHKEIPYKITMTGDVIPYYLAAYRNFEKPTDAEVEAMMARPTFREQIAVALRGEMVNNVA